MSQLTYLSGILISIIWFTSTFVSLIAGGLADKIGVRSLAITASVACIISTIMIYGFQSTAIWLYIIAVLIILGLGYGFYQSPNNKMLLSVMPLTFKTQVSSTMTLTKNLGSVLGNAFAGLIIATSITQSSLSKVLLSSNEAANFIVGFGKNLHIWSYLKRITFDIRLRLRKIRREIFIKTLSWS